MLGVPCLSNPSLQPDLNLGLSRTVWRSRDPHCSYRRAVAYSARQRLFLGLDWGTSGGRAQVIDGRPSCPARTSGSISVRSPVILRSPWCTPYHRGRKPCCGVKAEVWIFYGWQGVAQVSEFHLSCTTTTVGWFTLPVAHMNATARGTVCA